MFPIEFDHAVLDTLPLVSREDTERVIRILKAIVGKRIIPFFKKHRGTDTILVARVLERLEIRRLEDEANQVRCVSVIMKSEAGWEFLIHERIFDYLSFVIPADPDATLGGGTPEERKMLAFAEFMLRHDVEHILYPERSEREVVRSDVDFAMYRRSSDPTFFRMLRSSLADEMNGIKGTNYLAAFDRAERDESYQDAVNEILGAYVQILGDMPEALLGGLLTALDIELKAKLFGLLYRRSRETTYPLLRRTSFFHKLLRLFSKLTVEDDRGAEALFNAFKDDWGLVFLFQELDVPEIIVQQKSAEQLFELFKERLSRVVEEAYVVIPPAAPKAPAAPKGEAAAPTLKTLKDRIDEARGNASIPRQVIEVIDKNKLNAVGHSGSKYSELIETLLAIPWGVTQHIGVSAEEFEDGLDKSHYGLQKPKEILCDFFANLIWRYGQSGAEEPSRSRRNGSAFLFVGPPGVGKTSLAISVATNLGIPFHKISLGGMRDEADLKGHGFTYEGSKPGAIVQGLIKMGAMNGLFIMDEADKMEKFAVATLLEILDPEQNHLFHDKYTETTVDIDLSNCHFVLTGNTLETVPPPVVNRCEVVQLDRYSVDEKVSIARRFLIARLRNRYGIGEDDVSFDAEQEEELLRFLVRTYTYEAGVRELERVIRTLFLRISRKEILRKQRTSVIITREKIKEYLETPSPPRSVNDDDRIGEMMALGVNVELGVGSLIPIQATAIRLGSEGDGRGGYLSMIHATGNIQKIMDESRRVATTAILDCAEPLGIRMDKAETPIHLHFMGGSTPKDGPSAGGAVALALASVLAGRAIRRDVAMTGEIDTHGRITSVGGLDIKLETAFDAGCKTVIIPRENLTGEEGIERLSDALKEELQVFTYDQWKGDHEPFDHERHMLQIVAVQHLLEAAEVSFIDQGELRDLETTFIHHAREVARLAAESADSSRKCTCVLYAKDPSELDVKEIDGPAWANLVHVLFVRPGVRDCVRGKWPVFETNGRLVDYHADGEDFSSVLDNLIACLPEGSSKPVRISLVAPFYFLKNALPKIADYVASTSLEGFTLFANNYTAQRVKIKACKAVLNQVYARLAQLDAELLDSVPFLAKIDGIYVADLSYISEKYRLDVKRAERILNGALIHWLRAVDPSHIDSAH